MAVTGGCPGEVIANLSANAASELGLSQKVKVVQGGADALIGMIGLGVAAGAACLDNWLISLAIRCFR